MTTSHEGGVGAAVAQGAVSAANRTGTHRAHSIALLPRILTTNFCTVGPPTWSRPPLGLGRWTAAPRGHCPAQRGGPPGERPGERPVRVWGATAARLGQGGAWRAPARAQRSARAFACA